MAKAISFADGRKEYDINGIVTVRFNPTDESFVAKIEDTYEQLEGLQESFNEDGGFKQFGRLDEDMRAKIDALLGEGVSEALFGDMNCYAIADGLPVWMNLILAILDEVTEAYEREFGKTDDRFKAHNAKYQKMMAKYRAKGKR